MQRLTAFHHHKVRGIDHIVHARNADRAQSLDHPIGTRSDLDALNDTSGVARAALDKAILHTQQRFDFSAGFLQFRFGHTDRQSIQNADLTRHAEMT